jgi:acetolactate synthase I/II/III large subunit
MTENKRTTESERRLTGGRAVARALADNGVTHLFGVHGYPNHIVHEAIRLGIENVHFRHEQSAGFAADAYGRLTRKTGVCYASASAGMSNYLAPLSQGIGALSPMLLLVGQHTTAVDGLEGLQEGYAAECFKTVTKWTKRLTDWQLNSYWTQKALRDTCTYPPGPVCLEIPINNIWKFGPEPQRKYLSAGGSPRVPLTAGDPAALQKVADLLLSSKKPLIVAGDGVYWSDAMQELRELANVLQIPTNARRTARGAVPETDPMGVPAAVRGGLLREADLILLIGVRASELESWFEPPDWPRGKARYVQINEVAQELWYPLPSEVVVAGASKLVLQQLLALCTSALGDKRVERHDWIGKLNAAKERYALRRRELRQAYSGRTPIHTYELTDVLASMVDQDATLIYDSYSGALYLTDAIQARYAGQILDAGPRVALGQGIGMSIGAAAARPGKQIVTLVGDGGMGISAPDIETMIHYRLPCVVVVLNNSSWGGNALMGEDFFPGFDWSVGEKNRWDLAFQAFGAHGEYVERSEDLAPAIRRALESGKPAVVNVIADCDGVDYSQLWLRSNAGDLYGRGMSEIDDNLRRHYAMSPVNALRTHKMMQDWAVNVPLGFVAELTGNEVSALRKTAKEIEYDTGDERAESSR